MSGPRKLAAFALAIWALMVAPAMAQTTLRMVSHADIKILDPIWTTALITRNFGYMVYDTLFSTDADLKVQPQMAEKYTISDDKLTWTITLRDGLRLAMEIGRQAPLQRHLKDVDAVSMGLQPGSESDADLDRFIRRRAFSFYHPAGTCAMGMVVDAQLRVLGVDGLRVADTSIMPTLIGGNTNAPAIMIGEKAADLIRRDS